MGVVGAARVGGEVFSLDIPPTQRVATMLFLVAGFNLSLFLFNMLPLLPLDGGHIAGALWESVRRAFAKVFRRPDPGPFDVAKLMPVAYVVAGIFICFTLLVLVADVVNPVRLADSAVRGGRKKLCRGTRVGSSPGAPLRGGYRGVMCSYGRWCRNLKCRSPSNHRDFSIHTLGLHA